MSCDVTVRSNKQTELEFLQQLRRMSLGSSCCGPVTDITFTMPMTYAIKDFLDSAQRQFDYLDNFSIKKLDSGAVQLTMCARHWLQHSDLLHKVGHILNRHDFTDISFYMYKAVCLANAWDEKELSNYLG